MPTSRETTDNGVAEKTYKTTAKDFKTFARALAKWQKKMNLDRWAIHAQHADDVGEDCESDTAWIMLDYETLVCSVALAKTWPIKPTAKLLELAAFHECRHLSFAPMLELIPKHLRKLACQEEHRFIISDERMLFGTSISESGVVNDD